MRLIGATVHPPGTLSPACRTTWILYFLILLCQWPCLLQALTPSQVDGLRKETEDLFYHGYENYMRYAFPEDELRPISCKPLTRDRENPAHIEVNDPLGNYSLTLIDSLSTLAILASSHSSPKRNKPLLLFQNGVKDLVKQYGDGTAGQSGQGLRARGFDLDSKVQVFETAIRGLGGLLSAHLFAVGDLPIRGYHPKVEQVAFAKVWQKAESTRSRGIKWKNGLEYDGQLLRLAYDLGSRLIPAFWTSTGIPYPRVNLRSGIPFYTNSPLNYDPGEGQCDASQQESLEITETCSAGAGSLILEFTVLSRLTGDPRFEELAKRAFWAVWNRRSDLGLIGAGIDAETGNWINSWTGIGAGIDSFFEYALKSSILLSRDAHPKYHVPDHGKDPRILFDPLSPEDDSPASFYEAWKEAHTAIKRHIYRGPNYQHPHYIQADLTTGAARGYWIDALSAYYPGLLTLGGHVDEAIETHLLQTALWTRFSGLPERWNLITGGIEGGLGWWIGRPEFIESTYYLYRATEDPWYLHVGEMVLRDIKRRCWAKCGLASIQNVLTGEKTDRMESFFLGETAKYLFLLFDSKHPLNHIDGPTVFTTEGHPLIIPSDVGADGYKHGTLWGASITKPATCPVKPSTLPFSISATAARSDLYHAASLARLHLMPSKDNIASVMSEYAIDHPSLSFSDVESPSNYTYFPWTLPLSLVPFNATSSTMPTRPTFDITFPSLPSNGVTLPPLQRIKEGILINFLGGLRLGMIQDVPIVVEGGMADGYRIQSINNLALGKDEKVYLARDTGLGVLNPTDPNFTRIRDVTMLDIVIDLKTPSGPAPTHENHNATQHAEPILNLPVLNPAADSTVKSAWNAIVSQLAGLIKDNKQFSFPFGGPPTLNSALNLDTSSRYYIPGITSTGLGAAPIPDWPEAPILPSTTQPTSSPSPPDPASSIRTSTSTPQNKPPQRLLWTKIHAADDLCTHRLPLSVARNKQILIIRRGGCSFSRKLSNIPAYHPGPSALQLVIVVSFGDEASSDTNAENEQLIRPFLDEHQATPNGLRRHHPIPMVMVGGGQKVYDALKNAAGLGVRRRYNVYTQGVPIMNLVIL